MKKYLVTEHYEDRGSGDTTWETIQELPLNGKWLTREEVEKGLWWALNLSPDETQRTLDELFGDTP